MKMATLAKSPTPIEPRDAAWLLALLAEVRKDVASQPKPQAIARMRARLLEAMNEPVRAAA